MRVSKIFGCVLGLHVFIIAVLIVQPGCQTGQPPTQYTQDRATAPLVEAVRASPAAPASGAQGTGRGSLDSAFNSGFQDDEFAPREEFREFDSISPIAPIAPFEETPSVTVDGASFEAYTVKKGDSLWGISRRYSVSLNDLYKANGLNKNSVLKVGQQIQIPVEGVSALVQTFTADTYQPTGYRQPSTSYTVSRGDNLTKIANRFDTTVRAIRAANGKTSDVIRVGEVLVIPVGENYNSADSGAAAPPAAPVPAVTSSSSGGVHVVKAGEYPATIAKMYGMTTSELLAINGITDPRRMQIGQRLKVSSTGSANNVDSRQTVVPLNSVVSSASASVDQSAEPQEIRVIEADPLIAGELQAVEVIAADEPEPEPEPAVELVEEEDGDLFDNAVEIPVIRLVE